MFSLNLAQCAIIVNFSLALFNIKEINFSNNKSSRNFCRFIFDKTYPVVDDSAISEGMRALIKHLDQSGNITKEEKDSKRKLLQVAMKTVVDRGGFWLKDAQVKIFDENSLPIAIFRAGSQINKVVICCDTSGQISVKFTDRSFTKKTYDSVESGLNMMKSLFRGVTSAVAGLLGEKRQALTYGMSARCLECGVSFEYYDSDKNESQGLYFTKCSAHLNLSPLSYWKRD